jgi:hypothetical protein
MSWFSNNYEKAALGAGIAAALGLGVFGYLKLSGVDDDFAVEFSGSGKNDPAVADAGLVAKASAGLAGPRVWDQADVSGRPVDLFTGIPLFVTKTPGAAPVDPWGGEPIHKPIPNQWWLQYKLDPGFGDSPLRDPDGDGFTNLEEFEAKTDPTKASDFPSVIAKLQFIRDESVSFIVRPGFDAGGAYPFTYEDSQKRTNKTKPGAEIPQGGLFFVDGIMKERFKYLGFEERTVKNERLNYDETFRFVRIEDQQANKKGRIYEVKQNFSIERERNAFTQYDRTAVLVLDALGQQGQEFKIEENTSFSLPPDGPKKDYLLKSVTPEKIEVEFTGPDGAKKTVEIPKR